MDSLFEPEPTGPEAAAPPDAPLPARLRPTGIDEVVGQEHLLHEGAPLRRAIDSGQPHSMLLVGPPGSGKTTLARIVARAAGAAFEELSAVQAGRPEVRAVLERASERRKAGQATVFFLDEIHRFNKAQQDALLPAVEEGLVTLIGATTENPSFEVNRALLSRTRLYELKPLSPQDVRTLLDRAQKDATDEALELLAERSGGDARMALAALEIAREPVTLEEAEEALQRRVIRYDKGADAHYGTISAWIKATRGSDVDASLYYLATMIEGGEDPRFMARRMVIFASEDVGNADPQALQVAVAAAQAVEHVGMPEAAYALGQAAIYLSLAPKSDGVGRALGAARAHVREHGAAEPPSSIQPRAETYDNPHGRPGHLGRDSLLPEEVRGARFYRPDDAEAPLAAWYERIRKARSDMR